MNPFGSRSGEGRTIAWQWLVVPVLVLAPLTIVLGTTGFDGLYGQDPYSYYRYALGPLRQSLINLQGPPAYFWPPGYPLLILMASVLSGPSPLAGQLVSLVSGAIVPIATGLLAAQLWPSSEGRLTSIPLLAAGSMALVGQLWQSSMVVMSDSAGLAAATIGMGFLARYGNDENHRLLWLLLAAAAMAFGLLIRWAFALVAIPALGYALWVILRLEPRRRLPHVMAASLLSVAILWPVLPGALQAVMGMTHSEAAFAGDLAVYRWDPLNALRRQFFTSDGLLSYRYPNGLYYLLLPAHPYYFTPLLALLMPLGLWRAVRSLGRPILLLLVGWPSVLFFFHAGAQWQNFRFVLAYAPPLAILAAFGFETARQRIGARWRRPLQLYLVAGLALMAIGGWTLTNRFIERKAAYLATVRWAEQQMTSDSRVLTLGLTLTFEHYSHIEAHDLYVLTPANLEALLADHRPAFLLVEVVNLERQWQNMEPGNNYGWLRENTKLIPLGEDQSYTLFRIETGID